MLRVPFIPVLKPDKAAGYETTFITILLKFITFMQNEKGDNKRNNKDIQKKLDQILTEKYICHF